MLYYILFYYIILYYVILPAHERQRPSLEDRVGDVGPHARERAQLGQLLSFMREELNEGPVVNERPA